MRRGLYLLFEGLADTVVDSQVLVHVREMRAAGIVDFEVWCFAWGERHARSLAKRAHAEALSEGTVRILPSVRPGIPGSTSLNALRLDRELEAVGTSFELIHARTDYAAAVCGCSRAASRTELVWDCRGDTVSEIAARRKGSPLAALGSYIARRRVADAAAACSRAIFVSDALRRAVGFSGKPFEIIPCVASESAFFFDPALRRDARRNLDYTDSDRVMVYAGSLEFYQCLPESIALFHRLRDAGASSRLLVLTPEVARAAQAMRELPEGSYRLVHAPFDRVNEYLNAADLALMIRRPGPLNRVASPTKFAEYSLAGLPVVMSDAVEQSFSIAREIGNLVELREGMLPSIQFLGDEARRGVAEAARRRLSRAAARPAYARSYGCSTESMVRS